MKGSILDFQSGSGVISCEEGKRYNFSNEQWKSTVQPVAGMVVDFIAADKTAIEIYQSKVTSDRSVVDQAQATTSSLSIVSLIFGILGLFIFGSIIAIICGHISMSKIKASGGRMSGDGMALTGLILGYLGIVLWFIWLIFLEGIALLS